MLFWCRGSCGSCVEICLSICAICKRIKFTNTFTQCSYTRTISAPQVGTVRLSVTPVMSQDHTQLILGGKSHFLHEICCLISIGEGTSIGEEDKVHKYIYKMFLHPNNLCSASWNRAPVCNNSNVSWTHTGWFWVEIIFLGCFGGLKSHIFAKFCMSETRDCSCRPFLHPSSDQMSYCNRSEESIGSEGNTKTD